MDYSISISSCIRGLSQSTGLGGTFGHDLQNTDISLVFVALFCSPFSFFFFFLKMSPGVCVETDENVTARLGWLEEREMPSVV